MVMPVSKVNVIEEQKWHKAVDEWHNAGMTGGGMPYVGFYKWYTDKGHERRTGYVAQSERTHIWRPTKKKAREDIVKEIERWTTA